MLLAFIVILTGSLLLIWSADKFVNGASATAHHCCLRRLSGIYNNGINYKHRTADGDYIMRLLPSQPFDDIFFS